MSEDNSKFKKPNGELTKYAFACGYVQENKRAGVRMYAENISIGLYSIYSDKIPAEPNESTEPADWIQVTGLQKARKKFRAEVKKKLKEIDRSNTETLTKEKLIAMCVDAGATMPSRDRYFDRCLLDLYNNGYSNKRTVLMVKFSSNFMARELRDKFIDKTYLWAKGPRHIHINMEVKEDQSSSTTYIIFLQSKSNGKKPPTGKTHHEHE